MKCSMYYLDDIPDDKTNYMAGVECLTCHNLFTFKVSIYGINRYYAGELIQNALPELSDYERELLLTNTCGECFNKMWERIEAIVRTGE